MIEARTYPVPVHDERGRVSVQASNSAKHHLYSAHGARWLTAATDLLWPLPKGCPLCGHGRRWGGDLSLCRACLLHYYWPWSHCCSVCGLPRLGPEPCCDPLTPPRLRIFVAGPLYPQLRGAIHRWKYEGERWWRQPLGRLVARRLKHMHHQPDVLMPVPLTDQRQRERGFNQAEDLARVIAQFTAIPVQTGHLVRTHAGSTQVGRRRLERWHNMLDAFAVQDPTPVRGLRVVLVDDVVTTGATLQACARVLSNAGAASVEAVAVARTEGYIG